MTDNTDTYIGVTFLDTDPRVLGRRIRVIERHEKQGTSGRTAYRAEVVEHREAPDAVGRRAKISDRTLDEKYRRVSAR